MINKKVRGFTIIEILVGLTIIGMLFGFGYVSFRDFARRQSIAGVAKTLQGDIRLTQTNALSGIKPDNATCDLPNRLEDWRVRFISATEYRVNYVCSGTAVNYKVVNMPSGITMSTPAVNPIIFKVLGQGNNIPAATTVTVTLTQSGTGNTQTVTITPGGEVK